MATPNYISSGATISPDGKYRYRLWREWRNGNTPEQNWLWMEYENGGVAVDGAGSPLGTPKSVLFIMLNPSTADGETDDPTIRRCVGFCKAWGYDRLEVVNLFAFRTKSPFELMALNDSDDPVGPNNVSTIKSLVADEDAFSGGNVGKIICAWGNHGAHLGQNETVLGWLGDRERFALRVSKDGHPGHPLYLPATSAPIPFGMQRRRAA